LIPPFKFSLFRRDRLRKSGRPSLFEPSLKVQRDFAHNPPSGFEVQPPMLWCQRPRSSKGPSHTSRRHGESASVARALEVIGLYCGAPDQTRTSGLPRVLRGRSIDPAAALAPNLKPRLSGDPYRLPPAAVERPTDPTSNKLGDKHGGHPCLRAAIACVRRIQEILGSVSDRGSIVSRQLLERRA